MSHYETVHRGVYRWGSGYTTDGVVEDLPYPTCEFCGKSVKDDGFNFCGSGAHRACVDAKHLVRVADHTSGKPRCSLCEEAIWGDEAYLMPDGTWVCKSCADDELLLTTQALASGAYHETLVMDWYDEVVCDV